RLIRIILPKSVTSIESYEFNGCSSLRDIIIAEENPEYQSIDGVLYNKNLDTLIRYGEITRPLRIEAGESAVFTAEDFQTDRARGLL
ncbi:MAG: leucine-rich repeat domain-containing protein, partial [Acetatifactor sp.]|nr:leucine-rich repeat domain-containing protein [Acetatifactor sp.]